MESSKICINNNFFLDFDKYYFYQGFFSYHSVLVVRELPAPTTFDFCYILKLNSYIKQVQVSLSQKFIEIENKALSMNAYVDLV